MRSHLFSAETYKQRREVLSKQMGGSSLIWIAGNAESPKNYLDNTYHFRQNSNFLYYAGVDRPDFSLLIDLDKDRTYLCATDRSVEEVVWMGEVPTVNELAKMVGIDQTMSEKALHEVLNAANENGRKVHYLPPYRGYSIIGISNVLGIPVGSVVQQASPTLVQAVISQRSIKEPQEIEQMEDALKITRDMHLEVMYETRAGMKESELVGYLMRIVHQNDVDTAYPVILSINGEILHNHNHDNVLEDGYLLLGDFGAESKMHYAGDITRTLPVSGRFSGRQLEIYELVLAGQKAAIQMLAPGISYQKIHLDTAKVIAQGLMDLGIMKGDLEDAVRQGAHALFFPHGLGHMIGLDVHDMEDLDDNLVGYDADTIRSTQFGLRALRMGRTLEIGHVVTVEPGLYFIPALIKQWSEEGKFKDFINYDRLQEYLDFGGIRIEDNFVITADGARLLGPPIAKEARDIEFLMNSGRS